MIEVLADGKRIRTPGTYSICVRFNGYEQRTCLDDGYVSGRVYTLRIVASHGQIGIDYNGVRIDNKRIEEGDVFNICDYELRFSYR